MTKHAVIIGGGISGLSAAFFLSHKAFLERFPLKITLLESSERFGGVIRTLRNKHLCMESCADAFDGKDPAALELCEMLGLRGELIECASTLRKIRIAQKKDLVPLALSFSGSRDILKNPGLSLPAKLRLLLEPWVPPLRRDGDESIADFVRRRFGDGVLEAWAEPVARGVLMGKAEELSLRAYFPLWQEMEKQYGSVAKAILGKKAMFDGPAFFYEMRGGMDRLIDVLCKKMPKVERKLRSPVATVRRGKGWEVVLQDGRKITADVLGMALPAPQSAELVKGLAPLMAKELMKVRYDPVAVVNLVYRPESLPWKLMRPGFVIPAHGKKWPMASLKVIGSTEDRKFFRLRAFLSGTLQKDLWEDEDRWIEQDVLRCLSLELQAESRPEWIAIARYPNAMVQYGTGHRERVEAIERMLRQYPGLHLTGNGFRGFGITDCVRGAQDAAKRIFGDLQPSPRT